MHRWLPAAFLPCSVVSPKAVFMTSQHTAPGADVTGFDKTNAHELLRVLVAK